MSQLVSRVDDALGRKSLLGKRKCAGDQEVSAWFPPFDSGSKLAQLSATACVTVRRPSRHDARGLCACVIVVRGRDCVLVCARVCAYIVQVPVVLVVYKPQSFVRKTVKGKIVSLKGWGDGYASRNPQTAVAVRVPRHKACLPYIQELYSVKQHELGAIIIIYYVSRVLYGPILNLTKQASDCLAKTVATC